MEFSDTKTESESVKSEANGIAHSDPTRMIPGVGPGILIPKDVNLAIHVLVATFDRDSLRTLSKNLEAVVNILDWCGGTLPAPKPELTSQPEPKPRKSTPITTAEIEQMVAYRKEGKSGAWIAQEMGRGLTTTKMILKEYFEGKLVVEEAV